MKKLLFLLLILISCTEKKDYRDKERIIMLKKEISIQKSLNDSLLRDKDLRISLIDSLRDNINYSYLDKEVVRSFLESEMRFVIENNYLQTIFEDNFIDNPCFSYYYNSTAINREDDIVVDDEISFINYLRNKYNRNEKSIKAFFTKQKMQFIYSLFNDNDALTDSGLKDLIEALLLAYEETFENESVLNELYLKSLEEEDSIKYTIIRKIRSEKMLLLLKERKYCNNSTVEEDFEAFCVYSFWARRRHENNQKIVYKLLKDFYKNVHIDNLSEEDSDYEENYEEEDYDDEYRTLDDLAINNFIEPNQTEMDSITTSELQIMTNTGYNLEKLKEIYQIKFPASKPMKLHNILGEIKGGFSHNDKINYVNSGGWVNNSNFTVEIPIHNVYYVYVSKNNVMYQQLIYYNKESEILNPKEETPYDDSDIKIINKKQVVISDQNNDGSNKIYSEIFHSNMPEGKYLYFVKVITKKGNLFFSDIEIINCKRVK